LLTEDVGVSDKHAATNLSSSKVIDLVGILNTPKFLDCLPGRQQGRLAGKRAIAKPMIEGSLDI
jgi:hypothetical protein